MIDNDVIKYLIVKFEDKIRANPLSSDFVKLSNYYFINSNIDEAINLLHQGLKFYPGYVTARLLLGKCYLANKYYFDARKLFEDILAQYPDMNIAKKYLDIANDMAKSAVSRCHEDDIIPKLEFKTVIFNDRDFNYNLFPSYEIEDLINNNVKAELIDVQPEFTEFKNIVESHHFFKPEHTVKKFEKKRLKNKFEVKIITETLADIFARQGNYFDAIEAYTYLLKIKPEKKEQIESKISEVEVQIQKLINDF